MRADLEFGTIPRMALVCGQRFGELEAVVDGNVRLTFSGVAEEMLTVSRALLARGVRPGDRVALWAPNSAAWISAALGILASGAWLVPVNTRFMPREAAYILRITDARVLCVADGFMGVSSEALRAENDGLRCLEDPILLPGPGMALGAISDDITSLAKGVSAQDALIRLDQLKASDVSDVIFTSGTTGYPKGVMLRHGASLRAYQAYNAGVQLRAGDRTLIALPFFHCFGYKAGWMLSLMSGATTYPVAVFDPSNVMSFIETGRITFMPGAPTMFWALLNDPRRQEFDLSSLHTVAIAAASIPVELVRRLRAEMGVASTVTGYGLTENHALVSVTLPGDPPDLVARSVGKVVPDIEVHVVDDAGNELPRGAEGELLVRGYTHMTGYFGDPESTAAAFSDGWLRTGDVGTLDENDYVRITDRKKDIFIVGGFNVAPAEVEKALSEFEKIGEIAVVGVPDDRLGEVGTAFVVPRGGYKVTAEEILSFAASRLANFKVPRFIELVESLPTNATGKILKNELRMRWLEDRHAK